MSIAKKYCDVPTRTNKYLAEAIEQLQLFEEGSKLPKLIVNTIFDTITKGIWRDGSVTCNGLGVFYKKSYPERYIERSIFGKPKVFLVKAREKAKFRASRDCQDFVHRGGSE